MPKIKRKDVGLSGKRSRELLPVFIAACEGETEADILDQLRRRARRSVAQIILVSSAGDPMKVTETAIARQKQLRTQGIEVRHCFAVFDRDEHTRYESARRLARNNNVSLGISNPCIELWMTWLVQAHTASVSRQQAQRLCRTAHPGYDHDDNPYLPASSLTESNLTNARNRARSMAVRHESAGDPPDSNPSSTFGDVVDALLCMSEEN